MKLTNCVNCGAPLQSNVCAYCGTTYENDNVAATFGKDDFKGTLKVGDKEYEVYLAEMEGHYIWGDSYRTMDGKLHRTAGIMKHTFQLIEY